jgi:peptidoglycan hydrolase-like protein with peptidoglycan-binding domain
MRPDLHLTCTGRRRWLVVPSRFPLPVHPAIRSLAQDGRFTLRDAETLKSAVNAGQVSRAEASDVLRRYAEAMEPEAASALADTFQTTTRARLANLPEGFANQTLQHGQRGEQVQLLQRGLMSVGLGSQNGAMALASGADGIFGRETAASVRAFQKANGIPETGVADPATLRALQQAMAGTTPTASRPATPVTTAPPTTVRPATGLRRNEEAAPQPPRRPADVGTPTPSPTTAPTTTAPTTTAPPTTAPTTTAPTTTAPTTTAPTTPAPQSAARPESKPTTTQPTTAVTLPGSVRPATTAALAAAAQDLATGDRAKNYGTVNPWVNIDPRHAAPVDRSMGGLRDRWKCNLFGGNALAAAGFEPPYYGNRAKGGEYPVAESWQNWSTPSPEFRARQAAAGQTVTDYASKTRNASRFDLMDEVRPPNIADPAERQRRVEEFLSRVQPGDVVTVDHPGASGSDGGHVRVCVGRDEKGQPLFAQAKQDSAHVVAETADRFMTEDAMFILRPNTPRQALPTSTTTR